MKTTMIYLRQLLALCVVMVAFAACGDDEKMKVVVPRLPAFN